MPRAAVAAVHRGLDGDRAVRGEALGRERDPVLAHARLLVAGHGVHFNLAAGVALAADGEADAADAELRERDDADVERLAGLDPLEWNRVPSGDGQYAPAARSGGRGRR